MSSTPIYFGKKINKVSSGFLDFQPIFTCLFFSQKKLKCMTRLKNKNKRPCALGPDLASLGSRFHPNCVVWLNMVHVFFTRKSILNPFWPKTLRKHPKNHLTQKSIVLVVESLPMTTFSLFAGIQWVLLSPPTEKNWKMRKMKFCTKINFLKN